MRSLLIALETAAAPGFDLHQGEAAPERLRVAVARRE
jgi:hypothetical protein